MLLVPDPSWDARRLFLPFVNSQKKMFTRRQRLICLICRLYISSFSSLVTGGTCLDNSPNDGQTSAALERPP